MHAPRHPTRLPGDADVPIRGHIRCREFNRVSHGLFRLRLEGLSPDEEFRRELEAFLLVLPEGARFTHLTAARLMNWALPQLPEGVPVFAAVSGTSRRPRRPGLICSRLTTTPETPRSAQGLPVDDPEEILLRAARDLGTLDLRILVEGAMRSGDVDPVRMSKVLDSRRPGVRALRAAYRSACGRTESAGETVLLLFHQVMGVPVEPQKRLYDDSGNLVAVADLLLVGTDRFHEYDGAVHRGARQQATDLRRERGLDGTTYVRRGFVLDDLLNHSMVVMHELDRLLARPHRMARHRRWQLQVEQSVYHPVGRERLLNRWHREMGVHDWSRSG